MEDVQARISGFIDKYAPGIAALTRTLLARMEARLPGAVVMVYDNYNALVFGYGAIDKPSRAVLSLAVFRDHVTLCFLQGKGLSDPHGLLKGEGNQVRHIRLAGPETLDDPRVEALLTEAVGRSEPPFDPEGPQRLIVRSVSAKQRPRR
jgi:hypothetical protein